MDLPYPSPHAPFPDTSEMERIVNEGLGKFVSLTDDVYNYALVVHDNLLEAIGATDKALQKEIRSLLTEGNRKFRQVTKVIDKFIVNRHSQFIETTESFLKVHLGDCRDPVTGEPIHLTCSVLEGAYACCKRAGFSDEFCQGCFPEEPPPPPECSNLCLPDGTPVTVCKDSKGNYTCYDRNGNIIPCPPSSELKQCGPPSPPPPTTGTGPPGCCPPAVINVPPCPPPQIHFIGDCTDEPPPKDDDEEEEEEEEDLCPDDPLLGCMVVTCAPPAKLRKVQYVANVPFNPTPGAPTNWYSQCGFPTIEAFLANWISVGQVLNLWEAAFPGRAALEKAGKIGGE